MNVHLKPLVVIEFLPDGRLVLRPEHGPRLGRSSVILLCIHHFSIVCKGPDQQREVGAEFEEKNGQEREGRIMEGGQMEELCTLESRN